MIRTIKALKTAKILLKTIKDKFKRMKSKCQNFICSIIRSLINGTLKLPKKGKKERVKKMWGII